MNLGAAAEPTIAPAAPKPAVFTPSVLVCMPRYGPVEEEAMIAKLVPSSWNLPQEDRVHLYGQASCNSSLLPHAFNELFKEAYTLRDAGQVTHLAMIHADVQPEGYWLNQLWRLMRDRGDVAISAVSPIKDHFADCYWSGRTSTAFSRRSNPWAVHRYIRMGDRKPMIDQGYETFGPADVCQPGQDEVLLINTALMLIDLRHECWNVPCYRGDGDVFSFSFRNRITKDVDGQYQTWVRSEDWEMSRHMDRCGAPYSATWSIKLKHFGRDYWTNYPEPLLATDVERKDIRARLADLLLVTEEAGATKQEVDLATAEAVKLARGCGVEP